jgi:hypothetical protein
MSKVSTQAASSPRQEAEVPGSPEAIFAELQSLRKKYDAVVEYTVHLTAERDYHFTQLEELRREYSKEKSRKKTSDTVVNGSTTGSSSSSSNSGAKKSDKLTEKKTEQQGFSLLVVILVGLLSFLLARFMNSGGRDSSNLD